LDINNAAALGNSSNRFIIEGGSIDNTTGGTITTGNYAQTWNGDFTFIGTNALNLGTGAVTLGGNRTVTVSGASALTVGGVIAGVSYGLTKAGAGTLTISGLNTYGGLTTVSAGTLLATAASALPGYNSSGKVVFSGGNLGVQVWGSGWTTGQVDTLLSNATKTSGALGIDTTNGDLTQWTDFTTTNFGSTLGLTKLGAGILTLTGANTYVGVTTISAGTLQIGSGGVSGSLGAGAVTDNGVLEFNRTDSYGGSVSNVISGSGALTLDGGVLTLTGANNYTGLTTVNGGTLTGQQTSGTPFGTGAITLNGGNLSLAPAGSGSNVTVTGASAAPGTLFTIAGGATLSLNRGNQTSLTYTVGGTGTVLARTSNGTLVIIEGTVNSLGSATGERFKLNSTAPGTTANANLINLPIVVQHPDGTADFLNYTTTPGFASTSGNYTAHTAPWTTAANEIANITGSFTEAGTMTNVLSGLRVGAFTFTIGTGKTLTIGNNASYIAPIILNGGTIAAQTASSLLAFGASEGTIYTSSANGVINTEITGSLGLTKFGSGTLTLAPAAASTYTGVTNINQGTLKVGAVAGLGATGAGNGTVVDSGAVLDLNGIAVGAEVLTLNGSGISNGGALVNSSSTAASLSGLITLGSDSEITSAGSGGLTLTGGITNAGFNVTFDGANAATVSTAAIAGSGGLLKTGAGTLTLSGANTYGGGTTLSTGQLNINNAGSSSSNSGIGTGLFTISGGTIDNTSAADITLATNNAQAWNGDFTYAGSVRNLNLGTGAVTLGGNRQVTVTANTLTIGGVIDDGASTFGLTKAGTGTLTLSGANTYSGGTTINAGDVKVQNNTSLGTTAAGSTVAAGAAVQIDGNGLTIAEALTSLNGDGGGTGALQNLANNNTWSGAITLGSATRINSDAGTLTISGGITNGGYALTVGGAGNVTVGTTAITGNGGLTKDGAGILTLSGANTYSGTTTVSAGTLLATAASALPGYNSSGKVVFSGGNLGVQVWGSGWTTGQVDTLLSNATKTSGALGIDTTNGDLTQWTDFTTTNFGSTLGLTKLGAGILTLTGANTYAGVTTISAGTLQIGSGGVSGSLGAGAVTDNGTLVFNRTDSYGGSVGNAISGSGALTLSGGSLTLTGANGYTGLTTINGGTLVGLQASGTPFGTGALTLNGGTLSLAPAGSASNVTVTGASAAAGTLFTISGGGTLSLNKGTQTSLTYTAGGTGAVLARTSNGTLVITESTAGNLGSTSGERFKLNGTAPGNTANANLINLPIVVQHPDGTADFLNYTTTPGFASTSGNYTAHTASWNTTANEIANITGSFIEVGTVTNVLSGLRVGAFTFTIGTGKTLTIGNNASYIAPIILNGGTIAAQTATGLLAFGASEGTIYTSSANGVINTEITGSLGLTKFGSGTLTLAPAAASTYTGVTNINQGTVKVGAVAGLGATGAGNGTVVDSGAVLDLNGVAVGAELLTLSGSGISNGGALVNSSSTAASLSGAITLGGDSTLTSAGTGGLTLTGGITTAGFDVIFDGANATTVSTTAIAGLGGLLKAGAGTLTLSGANTYSGGTTLSVGQLNINNAGSSSSNSAIGTGVFTIAGGTIDNTSAADITLATNNAQAWNGDFVYAGSLHNLNLGTGAVTLGGNRQVTVTANTLTIGGVIDDGASTFGLTKTGAGTLTLSGANTYSGATTIHAGTLALGSAGSFANSTTITVGDAGSSGAVLDLTAKASGFTLSSAQTLKGIGTVNYGSGKTITNNGILAPGNSIGTLNITGNYTFGSTSTYQVETDATTSDKIAISGTATITSGASISCSGVTGAGKYVLATAASGLNVGTFAGTALTDYRLIYSATELDLQHKADQTLTGASPATINIITGATTSVSAVLTNTAPVSSSDLAVSLSDNGGTGGVVSGLSSSTGGTVVVGTPGNITGTFTAGSVGLGKTWSLKNTDSNAVTTSVNAGGAVNVYNHSAAALTVATGNNQSIITGGAFAAATLTLSDTVGATPAPLDVNTLSNLSGSTGSGVVGSGATGSYTATGFDNTTVGAGRTLSTSLLAGDQQTITGKSALSTLSQNLTYNVYDHAIGSTSGTLALGNVHQGYASPVTSGSVSAVNASGYRSALKGSATAIGNLSLSSLSGIAASGSGNITATLATGQSAGAISQAFTYTFADDSVLSGASSNVGTASLTVTGLVYSGTGVWNTNGSGNWSDFSKWTTNGGSPGLDAGFTTTDTATFGSAASSVDPIVTLNGISPSLKAVTFSNSGKSYTLASTGGGKLILNAGGSTATVNDTAGNHTISARVEMDSNTSVTVVNSADTLTVSGGVTESGGSKSLTKDGSGTLALTGVSTYTGTTSVQGGTLVVTGSLSGTTAVNVSSGAALYLSGSINVSETLTVSGTLSGQGALGVIFAASGGKVAVVRPGSSDTGTLAAAGLTIQSGAQLSMRIGGLAAGTGYDQLIVNGGITLAGDLTGSLINAYTPTQATFSAGHLNLDGSIFYLVIGATAPVSGTFGNQSAGNVYTGNYSTITLGGQLFAVSYTANYGANQFSGTGNDIALMAIPEPSVVASILFGSAFLLGLRRRRLQGW
jgi:autotransporter-associated beta strand protein